MARLPRSLPEEVIWEINQNRFWATEAAHNMSPNITSISCFGVLPRSLPQEAIWEVVPCIGPFLDQFGVFLFFFWGEVILFCVGVGC
jgi:hypothetical protein